MGTPRKHNFPTALRNLYCFLGHPKGFRVRFHLEQVLMEYEEFDALGNLILYETQRVDCIKGMRSLTYEQWQAEYDSFMEMVAYIKDCREQRIDYMLINKKGSKQ